jgi:hypothetical protein
MFPDMFIDPPERGAGRAAWVKWLHDLETEDQEHPTIQAEIARAKRVLAVLYPETEQKHAA